MKDNSSKIGIVSSLVVTVIAIGFVGSVIATGEGSIQPQGEKVIDRTVSEIKNIPSTLDKVTSNALEQTDNAIADVSPTVDDIIEESDSAHEVIENTADVVRDALPDVPKNTQQNAGKLLELVRIQPNTSIPGCEDDNSCYKPAMATLSSGGEVIWTNYDTTPHTVTSGNPSDGPNGLFESGLILPGQSYSLEMKIPFEYDYFCIVHPWMQGTIVVQ